MDTGILDLQTLEETLKELRGEIRKIILLKNGKIIAKALPEEIGEDIIEWIQNFGEGNYQVVIYGDKGIKKKMSFKIGTGEGTMNKEIMESIKQLNEKLNKLEEKLNRKENDNNSPHWIIEKVIEMQKEQFELLIRKNPKKESSFFETALQKLASKPELLLTIGSGAWKLIQKAISGNKNELIEIIKLAKDDPEIKEIATKIVSAKYGTEKGGILDQLISNPEIINKTLEIINRTLEKRNNILVKPPPSPLKPNINPSQPSSQAKQITPTREVRMDELIVIATGILEAVEQGLEGEEIIRTLDDDTYDLLSAVIEEYDIKTHQDIANIIRELQIPSFLKRSYLTVIQTNSDKIDEILELLRSSESVEPGSTQVQPRLEIGSIPVEERFNPGSTSSSTQVQPQLTKEKKN
jgi:hypothetical protein